MSMIVLGGVFKQLKPVIEEILTDTSIGMDKASYPKWCRQKTTKDQYVDVLELELPGFMAVKPEGQAIPYGIKKEGWTNRYSVVTYALQLAVSHEAKKDGKYEEMFQLSKNLRRSGVNTKDLLATKMISNGFGGTDASYAGDGLTVFNAAHTMAGNATFSNLSSEALSPSVISYGVIRTNVQLLPDHAGITAGKDVKRILFPTAQLPAWEEALHSKNRPDAGNCSAINILNRDLAGKDTVLCPLRFWDDSSTRWCVQTDEERGATIWDREPMTPVAWTDNSGLVMHEAVYCRYTMGIIDARAFYGVDA